MSLRVTRYYCSTYEKLICNLVLGKTPVVDKYLNGQHSKRTATRGLIQYRKLKSVSAYVAETAKPISNAPRVSSNRGITKDILQIQPTGRTNERVEMKVAISKWAAAQALGLGYTPHYLTDRVDTAMAVDDVSVSGLPRGSWC